MVKKAITKDTSWREPKVLASILGFVIFLSAGFTFIYDPSSRIGTVEGIAVGLHQPQTDAPSSTYLLALLDTGETVALGGSSRAPFKKDKRVIIEVYQTRIFHREKYRFLKYIEESEDTK